MHSFPVSDLQLFQVITREEHPYLATYNPSRKAKAWIDPQAIASSGEMRTYDFFRQLPDKTWGFVKDTMSSYEAATYNLEGLTVYPPYQVASTCVVNKDGVPVNPGILSFYGEVLMLQGMLGLPGSTIFMDTNIPVINWGSETRRPYMISDGHGWTAYAGQLLSQMYQNGVGSPGRWTKLSNGEPFWQANLPTEVPKNTMGVWDVPVRLLKYNERIGTSTIPGAQPSILVDWVDNPTLDDIYRLLNKLAEKLL